MTLPNLTDQNIQDTYQRVLQTDGENIYDGTGSALPLKIDGPNLIVSGAVRAQSYIVSESITVATSGSTIFGDSSDDTHQFIGNITSSGFITASGAIHTDGNISSSATVIANALDISGNVDVDGTLETDGLTIDGTSIVTVIANTQVNDALHVQVTDNESTDENNLIPFIEDAGTSTGQHGLEMDGAFHYNPSTGTVTATKVATNTIEGSSITLDASGDIINEKSNSGRPDRKTVASLDDQFIEYEFTAEDLPQFTGFQVKVDIGSNNQAESPELLDFRAVAVA